MRLLYIAVIVGLLIGCGGGGKGGKSGGAGASGTIPQQPLATVVVDHNGGKATVNDPTSPLDGASVDIPAGALKNPVKITIGTLPNTSPIIGALPIDFGPDGTVFDALSPATITVPYSDTLIQTYDDDPQDLLIFSRRPNGEFDVSSPVSIDQARRIVTATTTHFSPEEAKFSRHYLWFEQQRRLFDSSPVPYKITTRHVLTPGGVQVLNYYPVIVYDAIPVTIPLGKGTLTNFWKAGQRNVILIHGFQSSPAAFLFSDDPVRVHKDGLLWTLRNNPAFDLYDNIILYQYPSGTHVAENGKWLADTIKKNALPGFKTDIIAHSMGGIVARSAIQQFGLSPYIERLITLGSPHEGGRLDDYTAYISDRKIVAGWVGKGLPGLADILGGSTFLNDPKTGLNAIFSFSKIASTELYPFVAKKDAVSDNDGLVKETSAAPPYLVATPKHTETFINVEHSELYSQSLTNKVIFKIREKVRDKLNSAPVTDAGQNKTTALSSTGTNNPTITLDGSGSSDADPGEKLFYAWTQTGGPSVTITNATGAVANITPTQAGVYTFELTVSDSLKTSTDTVTITVNPPPFYTATIVLTDDAYIESTYTKQLNNYGGLDTLIAGLTGSNSIWTYQTFLRFEVKSAIPAGATILSATLTCTSTTQWSNGASINCYDANTTWSEHFLTWNSYYGTAFQGVPGPRIGSLTFIGIIGTFDATSYFQTQAATGITAGTAFSFAFDQTISIASKERMPSTPSMLTIKLK
ncbi:MAG: DNRLRE domain-containing protein [bacterium]|nr:DNRLRE domain-containing protein [bacterium]